MLFTKLSYHATSRDQVLKVAIWPMQILDIPAFNPQGLTQTGADT